MGRYLISGTAFCEIHGEMQYLNVDGNVVKRSNLCRCIDGTDFAAQEAQAGTTRLEQLRLPFSEGDQDTVPVLPDP